MRTHKPYARVAHRRSQRIDEVDGVPTTHTQHGWQQAWTVTDDPGSAAPLPFAANKGVPASVAVTAMIAVIAIATVAAVLSVTAGHPDQRLIVAVALGTLGLFCLLVPIPALARTRRTETGR